MPRPRHHFAPRAGWLNDPHGITWHDGRYHLFFQHVPDSTRWREDISWGHATSTDLVAWTEQPVALTPQDETGCWTGDLLVTADGPAIHYTSVAPPDLGLGRIRTAVPDDADWLIWSRTDDVVPPPSGLDLVAFRDPSFRRTPTGWAMDVGAGLPSGGAVLTFGSEDGRAWEYAGVLAQRDDDTPAWTGTVWECPHLVRVGDVHALVFSVWEGGETKDVAYALGDLDGSRFVPHTWHRLTHGSPYAPTAFADAEGRPCLVFWLRDVADESGEWRGALSVPYLLGYDGARLTLEPHPSAVAAGAVVPGTPDDVPDGVPVGGPVWVGRDGPVHEVCTTTALWAAGAP